MSKDKSEKPEKAEEPKAEESINIDAVLERIGNPKGAIREQVIEFLNDKSDEAAELREMFGRYPFQFCLASVAPTELVLQGEVGHLDHQNKLVKIDSVFVKGLTPPENETTNNVRKVNLLDPISCPAVFRDRCPVTLREVTGLIMGGNNNKYWNNGMLYPWEDLMVQTEGEAERVAEINKVNAKTNERLAARAEKRGIRPQVEDQPNKGGYIAKVRALNS